MDQVFSPVLGNDVDAYIDDVVIYGNDIDGVVQRWAWRVKVAST
jgi:hypothetical protein